MVIPMLKAIIMQLPIAGNPQREGQEKLTRDRQVPKKALETLISQMEK